MLRIAEQSGGLFIRRKPGCMGFLNGKQSEPLENYKRT